MSALLLTGLLAVALAHDTTPAVVMLRERGPELFELSLVPPSGAPSMAAASIPPPPGCTRPDEDGLLWCPEGLQGPWLLEGMAGLLSPTALSVEWLDGRRAQATLLEGQDTVFLGPPSRSSPRPPLSTPALHLLGATALLAFARSLARPGGRLGPRLLGALVGLPAGAWAVGALVDWLVLWGQGLSGG